MEIIHQINRIALLLGIAGLLAGMGFCFGRARGQSLRRLILTLLITLTLILALVDGWTPEMPTLVEMVPVIAGDSLLIAANVLFWVSVLQHKAKPAKIFDSSLPSEIVMTGPYRYIRHPIYLAYLLALSGVILVARTLPVTVIAGVLCIFYVVAAQSEEEAILKSQCGPIYQAYTSRTGLLLPRWKKFHL